MRDIIGAAIRQAGLPRPIVPGPSPLARCGMATASRPSRPSHGRGRLHQSAGDRRQRPAAEGATASADTIGGGLAAYLGPSRAAGAAIQVSPATWNQRGCAPRGDAGRLSRAGTSRSMSKSSARQRDSSSSASAGSAPLSSTTRRDDVHARRDRPGVEIVAVDDARRVEDVPPDVVEVHVPGRRLEQDVVARATTRACAAGSARR